MRVAIVGSRGYKQDSLIKIHDYIAGLEPGTVIVSGGAVGVDQAAVCAARALGFKYEEFLPDWSKHRREAGFIRNREMIATVDRVVAFWNGVSNGTSHAIRVAVTTGIPVEIIPE